MREATAGHREQAGVVPWRLDASGSAQIMLVTTRDGDRLTVPKGNVPRHLSPALAAAREAFEEAGLIGPLGPYVGSYAYRKRGHRLTVTLFTLRPFVELPIWPEARSRRRAWLPIDEAVHAVHHDGLRHVLAALPRVAMA